MAGGSSRQLQFPSWISQRFTCLPLAKVLERPLRPAVTPATAFPAAKSLKEQPSSQAATAEAEEPTSGADWTATTDESSPSRPKRVLPLNVGFAYVQLKELEEWPWHELCVFAQESPLTEAGIRALLEHMDFILELPQVCTGFMLTYNIQELHLQLDMVLRIMSWSTEPSRQARWTQLCLGWKIVVPGDLSFMLARYALNVTFSWNPPPCSMYLTMDQSEKLEDSDTVVCYHPGDSADVQVLNEISRIGSRLSTALPFAEEDDVDEPLENSTLSGDQDKAPVDLAKAAISPPPTTPNLPSKLDLGSVVLEQGYCEAEGLGFVKILGRDSDLSEEKLVQMFDFLDTFVDSAHGTCGFAITYDFTTSRAPAMSTVLRLAEWGAEPARQEKWQRLNKVCKVVVLPGVRYTVAKGVLSTFFFLCPPVCKTYLTTDPDELEHSSTVFEPRPVEAQEDDGEETSSPPRAELPESAQIEDVKKPLMTAHAKDDEWTNVWMQVPFDF